MKKRKLAVVPDIVWPKLPHLFDIKEEEFEKYSKIALLLFRRHRNSAQLLGTKRKYSEPFLEFMERDFFRTHRQNEFFLIWRKTTLENGEQKS